MTERIVVEYVGPPRGLSFLAHHLREDGAEAEYEPPAEYKDLRETVVTVLVTVVAERTLGPIIDAAVTKVKESMPGVKVGPPVAGPRHRR